uniref:SAM domain, SH3 domain and nuclear localisation signals 1b n=1 Tax=Poecilia mexicana TaxID=48701 RepID=A0A3B3Z0P3_9TELE
QRHTRFSRVRVSPEKRPKEGSGAQGRGVGGGRRSSVRTLATGLLGNCAPMTATSRPRPGAWNALSWWATWPYHMFKYPMRHRHSLLIFPSVSHYVCAVTLLLCASGGVTSGSNCSSNRESLRLEDEPTVAQQFCCRARVHTEFVPSPYDTESLTLKVGDVIDVIAKPPMGTWTGSLNGRTGNFKFIYVDVLTHTSSTALHEASQKSTVQEALRRLGLEEHALSLQRGGYQTVDDLRKLRESDLMELNVTQPEHRECLLAAVSSLQPLHSDSLAEDESSLEPERSSEDVKSRPRDSGCVMTEDTRPHFLSGYVKVP